eukprot:symbB.v1.2.000698.t1/scaffold40.1/size395337/2
MMVMAPHWSQMDVSMAPAPVTPMEPHIAPPEPVAEPEGEEVAEVADVEVKPAKKANVTLRLLSFEAAKKIAVVKEVRSMLGEGLKESKDKVESAPVNLKKGVPFEEAEALAEKLRAAGAEVSLE